MGGLFGDLPPPSKVEEGKLDASSASAGPSPWSINKMAPNLRKPSLFASPASVLRNQSNRSKAATLSQGPSIPARWASAGKAEKTTQIVPDKWRSSSPPPSFSLEREQPSVGDALFSATTAIIDEYDPARPNDYEELLQERKRKRKEEERKRDAERRQREEEERERERERELQRQRERVEREESERSSRTQLSISGEEAWKRRAMLSAGGGGGGGVGGGGPVTPASSREEGQAATAGGDDADRRQLEFGTPSRELERSPSPPREGFSMGGSSMTAAERMMMKMGWKAGQGLGKQEQGITTPLMAKKTDRLAGVIVNASPLSEGRRKKGGRGGGGGGAAAAAAGGARAAARGVLRGTPSRVVMLRNMVGPGEVDEELEDEVAGECQKYGTVARVLIFEITEKDFPDKEAVRIFVRFERVESATKAVIDLDGRFFGGRTVQAVFFDEERFDRSDLAPGPGEPAME